VITLNKVARLVTEFTEVLGEFGNLVKHFNTTEALAGLNCKIYKGINGLIGPNGAGKTTTIKVILGLIKADSGKAEVFGFDCWNESLEIRKRIGILYEKIAFYDHLTGLQHLNLIAKLKGIQDPAAESKKVLKLVELETEAHNRKIKGYSAGMRQRIGLAHALLGNPELVILDEPTSNLDPLGRARVIEIINMLKKDEGFSFLISSHILPELERVCEHVVLMHRGKAIREGSLTQLLNEVISEAFMIKASPAARLMKLLKTAKCAKEVKMEDDYIHVAVTDSREFKKCLPTIVSQAEASLEEVKVAGRDLESLFTMAVSQR
jgi:ABC-type multidrug transport system ATPase subunit